MEQGTGSKLGKEYIKVCTLSPCLFSLYAGYIMQNARLDEAQTGTKIASRNVNNLSYAGSEEELKSFLMRVIELIEG